jgi:hypothetical protein
LREILGKSKIEKYARSLGRFLAFLHYGAKIDGYGIECILGHILGDKQLKLFVIDFAHVKRIDKYDTKLAQTLAWFAKNNEAFPRRGKVYAEFKQGYMGTAETFTQTEFAEMVMEDYEKLVLASSSQ